MNEKIHSVIVLTLLLIGMFTLAFNIQPVKAETTTMDSLDPMINPKPGQYANYSMGFYDENGTLLWLGWWNFSYVNYLVADLINTTLTITYPEPVTYWMAINKTDRWIPFGNHWWVNSWYVLWIETNITVGSTIKMWKTDGTVIGTTISTIKLNGQEMSIDCWKAQFSEPWNPSMNYTVLFDKQSGVMIELTSSYEPYTTLTLVSTNIPIGWALPITIDELKATVEELGSQGHIDSQGIVQSLHAKLNVAQKLIDDGKIEQAKNILNTFINEIQAQSGKHITPEAAEILIESAEHIISNL